MGGASSYLAILAIAGFLSATWVATKVSKAIGISSIVLEITTGVILGPQILGLISEEYATCEHLHHTKCKVPDDFMDRVHAGQPLGKDLGRIASMDYCNLDQYTHLDGSHHDESSHDESSHDESHQDDGDVEPAFIMPTAIDDGQPITGLNPEHGQDDDDSRAVLEHDSEHEDEGVSEAEPESESESEVGEHNDPGHRRLGGGGGDYNSYSECIEKSCEADVSHHCGLTPDVFTLIGHAGVALMIFESGMHFDFEKAQVVGPWACVVAVLGTFLPLISGTLLTMAYGYPLLPDGVAVGTALAPTSVGIALRLLGEAGVLQKDFGQAIITAAFVDDILSLILFNVLFSLRGDFDALVTVVYPVIGIIFMGIAMVLAVKFWPNFINYKLLPRLPKKAGDAKVSADDEGLFFIMMALLIVYGTITHFLGTHLWGCFIAGMSFACIDKPGHEGHTHHVWVRQTKRYTGWMIRIFFSCTVAFSIPVADLLSFEAFWKGSLMGIGPCVLTKVLCAPFMGDARFVIGWAMVGRAEFAYLIAQMAAAGGMIDEAMFSICIWALLYATIFAPFVFRTVLNKYIATHDIDADTAKATDTDKQIVDFSDSDVKAEVNDASDEAQIAEAWKKRMEDLDKVELEGLADTEKGAYKKERGGTQEAPLETDMADTTTSAAPRRKLWWGRMEDNKANNGNGFLCCLFFRRIVLN